MTKEQAIEVLHELDGSLYDTQQVALDMAIKALEQQPSEDCVSLEVYKQVVWERDIAIEQLKELGYSFGEKIRTSDDCVSREAVLDLMQLKMGGKELYKAVYDLPPVTPTFPKGATNGDMIKAMFPNVNFGTLAQDDVIVNKDYSNNDELQVFIPIRVWNALYKRGSENG